MTITIGAQPQLINSATWMKRCLLVRQWILGGMHSIYNPAYGTVPFITIIQAHPNWVRFLAHAKSGGGEHNLSWQQFYEWLSRYEHGLISKTVTEWELAYDNDMNYPLPHHNHD